MGPSLVIVVIIIIVKIHWVIKEVILLLWRGFFNGLNIATVSYMGKFPTVSTCCVVAFVRFFGDDLIFSTAEWVFLLSVTNTLVSFFLSFGFMSLKTILPIKHTIAIRTMDGRLNPGGKVRTGFILTETGRTILPFAIMMTRILYIIASITMAAIIGSVH